MNLRVPLLFALCVPFASSCFQQLDKGAAAGEPFDPDELHLYADGGFPVLTETPAIEKETLDDTEEVPTTTDACDANEASVMVMFGKYCASCHDKGPQSQAGFDFVMNKNKLTDPTVVTSSSTPAVPKHFIVPGDCAKSVLYEKIATGQMPPKPIDVAQKVYPKPTLSDLSVLHHWITNCLGGKPSEPPPRPQVVDAGTTRDAAVAPVEAAVRPPPVDIADAGPRPTPTPEASTPTPTPTPNPVVDGGREGGGFVREAGPGNNGGAPCAGLCQNPTRFSTQPPFMSGNLGANAVCFETTNTPTTWSCANFDFMRPLMINGMRVNCGMLQPPTAVQPRNGGYCFQAPPGGNAAASFTAQ